MRLPIAVSSPELSIRSAQHSSAGVQDHLNETIADSVQRSSVRSSCIMTASWAVWPRSRINASGIRNKVALNSLLLRVVPCR